MRRDDTTPPITVLLTPQERWTRAQERWKRQQRRFGRRRAPLSAAPTLDAIPAAVAYKDLAPGDDGHAGGARAALP